MEVVGNKQKGLWFVVGVVVLLGAFWVLRGADGATEPTDGAGVAHSEHTPSAAGAAGDAVAEAPGAGGSTAAVSLAGEGPGEGSGEEAGADAPTRQEAWEAIRGAIERARRSRLGQPPNTAAEAQQVPGEGVGHLEADYIRDAIGEAVPLLGECYELAREEDDTLEGRLVLQFTIGGEPDVGGVVEEVAIDEESELHHPILDECVRETIYTIELPAPEEGGRVNVTYPVNFTQEAPEEAAGEAAAGEAAETPPGASPE